MFKVTIGLMYDTECGDPQKGDNIGCDLEFTVDTLSDLINGLEEEKIKENLYYSSGCYKITKIQTEAI